MAGLVIKNDMSAMNTLNIMQRNQTALSQSLQRVSSGMRINSAKDDPSGYAIAESMSAQLRSLEQDTRNAQNGQSMMKVAEGAVQSTVNILSALKAKVIDAANDTNSSDDRRNIQKELDQAIDQIDDNANVTYNGKYLVNGTRNTRTLATATALTNESLSTATSFSSSLTELRDRNGDSLNILSTDTVTVSYVSQGSTYTTSMKLDGSQGVATLANLFTKKATNGTDEFDTQSKIDGRDRTPEIGTDGSGNTVYTADFGCALTIYTKGTGLDNQLSGFTISVTDANGAIKRSVNAVLDNFSETIRAQNASPDNSLLLHTGTEANQAMKVSMTDMGSIALGLKGTDGTRLSVATQEKANAAINVLETALKRALDEQASIGATQSRLDMTIENLTTAAENTQRSISTIRDADMAKEMTEYTKNRILLQASQTMLAHTYENGSRVLSLLDIDAA
ncbi:MAG: flagellin [Schwartzia sp.]|nr:flagellin [Schwartzia sp. (in: firmicutes)]